MKRLSLRHGGMPIVAAAIAIAALPLQRAVVTVRASANPSNGAPDPCAHAAQIPGKAKGVEKRCDDPGGGSGIARADFNGDGIGDLAIGVSGENVGTATNAGAINVIYGSAAGLTAVGNQLFTQDSPGVIGTAERDDHFGKTLAAVDINNDGISDLAVGVPDEDDAEGLVEILIGSANGLTPSTLTFSYNNLKGGSCACHFGSALAWGDFDKDGKADLAIGMSSLKVSGVEAGGVIIVFGNDKIVTLQPALVDLRDALGNGEIYRPALSNASFGLALAVGDRDGDGFDDLAVGAPLQGRDTCTFYVCQPLGTPGAVFLYRGGSSAITFSKMLAADKYSEFGRALAFADFDGDGKDDLAVGAPEASHGGRYGAGEVFIFYGVPVYPIRSNRTISQDDLSPAKSQSDDHFGWALAAADFDGDGRADLAISAPGEDFGNPYTTFSLLPDVGVVHVLYGYDQLGLPLSGRNEIWHQDTSGVPGANEGGDRFGYSLSAWNFGNGPQKDLAIGIPYEDISDKVDAGAIVLLYGAPGGLSTLGAQMWHQDSPGIAGTASANDRFGSSMY